MKQIIKKFLPFVLIRFYRFTKSKINQIKFRNEINHLIKSNKEINLIVGSGDNNYKNWVSSNYPWFDITNIRNINKYFKLKKVNKILAEHVFEHLSLDDGIKSIKNLKKILKINGTIRLAVPDGFNPDKNFIEYVKPNGKGPGADDHKILYNYNSIKNLFDKDFKIYFYEYFDESGNFNYKIWQNDEINGYIKRSRYEDKRNTSNEIKFNSIILDAKLIN